LVYFIRYNSKRNLESKSMPFEEGNGRAEMALLFLPISSSYHQFVV